MEDPIRIPIDDDVGFLPVPPMDLDFLAADFNDDNDGGGFVGGVDFDFSFDDLEFADNLLLESPQSEVLNPNCEHNLSNGETRVYDFVNNGSISPEESNLGEKLEVSSPNSSNLGHSLSNCETRAYHCLNQGLVSSVESNFGGELIDSMYNLPNCDGRSPDLVQNRSSDQIKVHDSSNQGSVSSKESNVRGELNSSLKSLNCNDRSPNSDQIQSSDEIRVYGCSKPVPVSSEESNFSNKMSCHSPNSSDLGNKYDRDVSSNLFVDNNSNEYKLSECNGSKRKIKAEKTVGSKNNSLSKRKREQEQCKSASFNVGSDGDDKRKARLMRNRESAQLSRQRKKQYVEELEDKVRSMHSTITDLHSRISYVMSENAALRQQLFGGAGAGAGASVVPPPVMNGMYPMGTAPMPYPWMPCPPYMVKPQGSQVPLVPIPRLKPQQSVSSSKGNKKGDGKKNEGKTKKVASISLLGLLFFFLLFGGLLPLVNVRYGGSGEGFGVVPKGKVLMVNNDDRAGYKGCTGVIDEDLRHGRGLQQLNKSDGFDPPLGNCSEPLTASLYVPRNDKLVKIDGNLIIHSVLASERAVATHTEPGVKTGEETSLAIVRQHPPYPVPRPGKNDGMRPEINGDSNGRRRAIGSSFSDQSKSVASDGKLQQWFREGLAGPMLTSGMCTEVFQFDISPTPGSIVPATFISNTTSENFQNSTQHKGESRNRRILKGHSIPLDGKTLNTTEENMLPPNKQHNELKKNTQSSIVVSVLVDPREVGDGDGEGVIRSKTLSRIFVVVLIDSVKYVTYSCMLPFLGPGNHLVTT